MSPETTEPTPAPAAEAPKSKSATGFVVTVLPILAFVAWAGAVVIAIAPGFGLNPWGSIEIYSWKPVPVWASAGLLALSAAFFGIAVWRRGLPWAYAAAAPLIPLGTGPNLIRDLHLLKALIFALCVFLTVEYLSGIKRFQAIADATKQLEGADSKPVKTFVARYFGLSVGLVVGFSAFLYVFILYVVPGVTGLLSPRLRHSIESSTAWGITLLAVLFFAIPLLGRYIWEGVQEAREEKARKAKEPEAAAVPPPAATPGAAPAPAKEGAA